jgi:hypothetical protein
MKSLEDEVYEVLSQNPKSLTDSEITSRVRANRIVEAADFWKRLSLSLFSTLSTDDVAQALGKLQTCGRAQSWYRLDKWRWGLPRSFGK